MVGEIERPPFQNLWIRPWTGTEKYLSPLVSAFRKAYSIQHAITKWIDDWSGKLDQSFTLGYILADPSELFDCIPHDLLIEKLEANGFTIDALSLGFPFSEREPSLNIVDWFDSW